MGADKEIDMYETVCKDKFQGLADGIKEVKGIAEKTHNAICVSNGKKSILSRLDAVEDRSEQKTTTKWGIQFQAIESRDIPRIIGAIGITVLVLERFGALEPLIRMIANK